ncbi:hypothetical protein BDN70DRAFT_869847 [Pholiota conissans]|uniref:Uncharacterized protein n=1 Tax=Pholiota conissans TaxID=109636 RepID=A0A9P5ZGR3_9AGAR|nr:hypothetical protein BDN70DRAFT_869847 [Pholiota conissans]
MSPLPNLPPEIWLEIFEWAAYNPNFPTDIHAPFERIPDDYQDSNLEVRINIASVCSTWRTWIVESLYKDIEIRHGAHALQRLLEACQRSGRCYGEMVRRVVLPYRSTVTSHSQPLQSIEILKLCPKVHTLLRPQHRSVGDEPRFDREAECTDFPSVQRLEWWHYSEAERTGGINSLGHVLRNIPNLRYLFIGGVVGADRICSEPGSISLTKLETLRLCIRSGSLFYSILSKWRMPMLRHIVMDSPPVKEGLEALWDALGHQLESVGFGKHLRFLTNDSLSPCLQGCPNLKEVNFYLLFTAPLPDNQVHIRLRQVGLHAHVNPFLANGAHVWDLIALHFDILCGPNFPSLQKVVLYGDWRPILSHRLFQPIDEKLHDSGRILQFARDA